MSDDKVQVYRDSGKQWRWRRKSANGTDTLSESSEGYTHKRHALDQAAELNPDVSIFEVAGETDALAVDEPGVGQV